jgi:hypothetical protein
MTDTLGNYGKRLVKMNDPEIIVFAFLVGLVINGLAGTLIELRTGRPASFAAPLFAPERPLRSLALSTAAGPWMLVNDAINARRERTIGRFVLFSCFATSIFWTLAMGIVLLDFATRLF